MSFLSEKNPDRWYQLGWWLCVITLPWLDKINAISIILLAIWTLTRPQLKERILRIKSSRWAWPFFIYYGLLVIGMAYTPDVGNGLFTLEKKFTFIVLPLIAIWGSDLNAEFVAFLKRSFVYSCSILILLSLSLATINYLVGANPANFDLRTYTDFKTLHPNASFLWMHFSYIQLAQSVGMHPAYFSMYLVFCLTILFTQKYSTRRGEILHLALSVFISCFTAMLSSRMAIIAFVVSAVYLIAKRIREKQPLGSFAIFLVTSALGFLLLFNPITRFRMIEEPMATSYVASPSVKEWNSVNYRLLEWKGSWSVIEENLLLGVGTGGWIAALDHFYSHYNPSTAGLLYNSHNQFLQTWMENGIIALIAFLFCVFGSAFRPGLDQNYITFILIFSLMCLTESIAERQKGIVFFTLFQTLFLAFENKSE